MSFLSVRGLVLQSNPYKENDRMLRILTKEHGILSMIAPGAAKSFGRFCGAAQPMMLCDFTATRSHDFLYLKEVEIVESFSQVHEDLVRLTAAAHMIEITSDVCVDRETSSYVYKLLVYATYTLTKASCQPTLIVSIFEWKIAGILGFKANLSLCSCGESKLSQYGAFSFSGCYITCKSRACLERSHNYQFISYGTIQALIYIQDESEDKIFAITVSDNILDEMAKLTRRYICERLEKNYCRMDLLSDMPSWDNQVIHRQTDPINDERE